MDERRGQADAALPAGAGGGGLGGRVKQYMREQGMACPGQKILIGLSGGADSVCLLYLLWSVREEMDLSLRVVHVHHGLRGEEADRDASFSRELCRKLGIEFTLIRADVAKEAADRHISREEAGRLLRYEAFEREACKWEEGLTPCQDGPDWVRIAVAHHRDDSAETILGNLFRGSGLRGLCGIPPVRGRVIRPLLCASRQEILGCLKEAGQEFVTDSTNLENDYTRNRIRNQILPAAVAGVNSRAAEHVVCAGALIREADDYFTRRAEELLDCSCREEGGRLRIPLCLLEEISHIEAAFLLRRGIERIGQGLRDLGACHVEAALALAEKATGSCVCLPGGLRAERSYENLVLYASRLNQEAPSLPLLSMEVFPLPKGSAASFGQGLLPGQGEIPKNQYTKWFDYDRIKDILSVRYRLPGDYITLKGGGRKSLKSLLIDDKIPREERSRIPLLTEGSHVLWVIGGRISEFYKVTESTVNVLKVHLDGGRECV